MTGVAVLDHVYSPRGACAQAFECRDPELVLSGPAGTGKSRACLEKVHMMALLNPGMRALVVRKTLVSLASSAVQTYEKFVAVEHLAAGAVKFFGGSQREAAQYRYSNGSSITLGGMDRPSKVMSTEYDAVYVQEAIELTVEDWEALTTRLRNYRMSFQQLIADTNPSTPTHWLKERANAGQATMLESRHEDNPTLYADDGQITERGRDYIDGKLDKLTGPRKSRLRYGQWVAAEGVIYDTWDEAVHLVDRFWVPKEWDRWWVVDFGYAHPFVLQRWAEDPDGRLYLYAEQYRTKRLVEDHARDVMVAVTERSKGEPRREEDTATAAGVLAAVAAGRRHWSEPEPRGVICDHDAEDRATLERHLGRSTSAARKSVSDGLQAVQSRLKVAGDGRPRLMIMRDTLRVRDQGQLEAKLPTSTAEEIPGYVWSNSKTKEAPLKENDDGSDCVRYMVAERDLGAGQPNVRWLT